MHLIGITGGVGAGKTEILSFIKKHYNCKIYLADEVAHLVQSPGEKCYEEIVSLLGKEILTDTGSVDKGKMAAVIFNNAELLEKVNAIVHPAVKEYLKQALEEVRREGSTELFFIEAALLIESGYKDFVDEMWYIHASDEVRRMRLMQSRGYSPEKIAQIMSKQLAEEEFRKNADFIIDNSGTLESAYSQIKKRLEAYTWQE
ncbi:MAG: dephospho-CoA kinase [Lachnospiraceae bacterium]